MIKKIMSIALVAIVFVFTSGFTLDNVSAKKVVVFEGEYDDETTYTGSIYDECAGEVIDYVINETAFGTVVIYDDGSIHQNFHYNYYNSSGVGQTTGKTYHFIGAGHFNINGNVGEVVVITQQANMIGQGMGVVSKFKADLNIVTNANGEVVVERIGDQTTECK